MQVFELKSAQFRQEREKHWKELEKLVDEIEQRGMHRLPTESLHRLPILYRGAVSALSVARSISLDQALLLYLEGLVRRAYICLYGCKRPGGAVLREFFAVKFPAAVFVYRRYALTSLLLLLAGVFCSFSLTMADMERYYSFIPASMAQGRTPSASTESLRSALYDGGEASGESLGLFASFLFTHNAQIGILCFSLGFACAAPAVILIFYNGMILGAMVALYHSRGLGMEFCAWVFGHGVTELGAVVLCGAAGIALGTSVLFPGAHSRLTNLSRHGRRVAPIVVGCIGMFFLAGLIEGIFRQRVQSIPIRWLMSGGTLVLWVVYFFGVGRRASDRFLRAG